MKKKSPQEIVAQLKLTEWLLSQPNTREAVQKAHRLLVAMQFDSVGKKEKPEEVYKDKNFLIFWERYPKKVGKTEAYRKWVKLKPGMRMVDTILKSVEAHARSKRWKEEDGKYIPNPATFLHQGRYEDVIPDKTGAVVAKSDFIIEIVDGVAVMKKKI
jgi:hypothetical protein